MAGPTLESLTLWLEREYQHWDYIYQYGCQDPFHPDGVNLDLTRNHIIAFKHDMDKFMAQEEKELTLFTSSYPEIYYRELPPKLPYDYMARADEIRARAAEQLALYEQDPNFCYIRDHHREIFPDGQQTRAAKTAGFYPTQSGHVLSYYKALKNDDLVDLRRMFYEPYEKKAPRWAELAQKMREYLSADHSKDDMTPVRDEYDDEEPFEEEPEVVEPSVPSAPQKPSLDAQISSARERAAHPAPSAAKEEQISLF